MLPKESTVSSVMLPNIGIPSLKDVSLVSLDTLGTTLLTNAHAVKLPEALSETIVYALTQKLSGIMTQRPAHAQSIALEINVFYARPQGNGTSKTTHVSARHQQLNGTEPTVLAQQEDTDQAVLNAQPQDTGMTRRINVYAMCHSFGMVKTVSAHHHTSCIKEDAPTVQLDTNGRITDVRNANVHSRT